MEHYQITETDLWAYISKTADVVTIQKVEQWMNSSDFDERLFAEAESIYKTTGENPYNNDFPIDTAKERFFNAIETEKSKSYNWKNVFKYAAIFVLIVTTATYTYQQLSTRSKQIFVQTTYGEQKQLNLPDGSIVWLNSSSKLSYASESPRKIYLEGEAFFKVAKDKEHPFTVTTPDHIEVKALGTSFNVKSYAKNSFTETVLLTGKVEVTSDKHFKDKIEMLPNDKVTFFKNDKRIVKSNLESAENTIAWKEGKIQFKSKSFNDIAMDLSIQFNIKISFENEQISNSKFTGSFDKTTPFDEILETLQLSKHFEFKKINDNKWIIK